MVKYDIRVGFSGHFLQNYEVKAPTKEAAEELLEHAIANDAWLEPEVLDNVSCEGHKKRHLEYGYGGSTEMEITDWHIDDTEEAADGE